MKNKQSNKTEAQASGGFVLDFGDDEPMQPEPTPVPTQPVKESKESKPEPD